MPQTYKKGFSGIKVSCTKLWWKELKSNRFENQIGHGQKFPKVGIPLSKSEDVMTPGITQEC